MNASGGGTDSGRWYSAGIADLARMAKWLRDESTDTRASSAVDAETARAIGFRCDAVAGADATRDMGVIQALAHRHGYELPHMLTVASHIDSGALLRLVEHVHVARAGAVIVPSSAHLGGAVPAVLTQVCSVIMPGHVMLGRCLYPSAQPSGVDRSIGVVR
ncbi:hypothetical protein OHA40_03480 [Nocardia sp. NBC_00508]|uniref:hypothetical protein n=1 Tax=Nocardia sp. NBC_00508 TaxID=2975992 RepID=UPI002E7FE3AD|nr:hypothetical protein [Nocardia sp. NBC_00508]WUD67237.1 hypothetical protein OHA40_03480 [Nocardia sp. NBC_00508]